MKRCKWTGDNPLLIEYHDKEWGVPLYDDKKQFEFLCLEVMQCGLSWMTVLKKRGALRAAFDGFDPDKVVAYDGSDIDRIMGVSGIIRSTKKIAAIINNAKCFIEIQNEFGSFSNYIWKFTDFKQVEYPSHINGISIESKNELSDMISNDMKKRGFSFVGSITIYSHLQAVGIINDHCGYCFRYKQVRI